MRSMLWPVFFILLYVNSCSQVEKTTVYNDRTYAELTKAKNVRIKHIDGKEFVFYRMEVMKTDESYIYARCWEKKNSKPVDYKFNKQEVVIESSAFSGSMATNYFLITLVTVGIIILIPIILSKM